MARSLSVVEVEEEIRALLCVVPDRQFILLVLLDVVVAIACPSIATFVASVEWFENGDTSLAKVQAVPEYGCSLIFMGHDKLSIFTLVL